MEDCSNLSRNSGRGREPAGRDGLEAGNGSLKSPYKENGREDGQGLWLWDRAQGWREFERMVGEKYGDSNDWDSLVFACCRIVVDSFFFPKRKSCLYGLVTKTT